ncbi:unannotated protein [freshwater metagenome]|uniref:Unannotated protein n=1 Tax=freshwater metagenome TaxID=449393 RepID=A0A6J7ETU3_9ZZZZ|nr:hypothetical protein [Actinomycetota bacterium]
MIKFLLLLLTLYISVVDIRSQKISNRSNLALAAVLISDSHTLSILMTLLYTVIALALSILINLGMGDFKLVVVLLLTQSAVLISHQYFSLFLACASLTLVTSTLARKGIKGSVAFGPTILLPFTAIYLVM